jgi:hypothetical protein
MNPAELRALDTIGLPRFTPQQAKAIVDRVRKTGALVCDPPECEGSGIVIAGGGRYLSWSWVLVKRLREMGCKLPIQVWHLGPREMPAQAIKLFAKMGAETVDAHAVMMKHPVREMGGWVLKSYAITHCPWRHVLFLDADCTAEILPEEVMNDSDVRKHGSLFFYDVGKHHGPWGYIDCSLIPLENEWETGQMVIDKVTGWMAMRWINWMSEHSDVFYVTFMGDKGVFEAGYRMAESPHLIGGPSTWSGWGISHSFKGREAFTHRMAAKRGEWPMEPWMQASFDEWKSLRIG